MHVALYARVSTTRQAENELSIPDQLRQLNECVGVPKSVVFQVTFGGHRSLPWWFDSVRKKHTFFLQN